MQQIGETVNLPGQESTDIDTTQFQHHGSIFQFAEIHQLVDKQQQAVGILINLPDRIQELMRQRLVLHDVFRGAGNQREWCAQLVGEIGKKLNLHPVVTFDVFLFYFFYSPLVFIGFALIEIIKYAANQYQCQKHIEYFCPSGQPERGMDYDTDTCRFSPDAVTIASLYIKGVISGRQMRIDYFIAPDVVPVFIQSVHLVGIFISFRKNIVQRGEFNDYSGILVRELYVFQAARIVILHPTSPFIRIESVDGRDTHYR